MKGASDIGGILLPKGRTFCIQRLAEVGWNEEHEYAGRGIMPIHTAKGDQPLRFLVPNSQQSACNPHVYIAPAASSS